MPTNDIGPRIGITGEKEFRDSIQAINAQMKSLNAEMKAVSAEFAANAQSEEALAAKNDVLGKSVETAQQKISVLGGQLDRQKGKLSELGAELNKAAAEFGENSTQAAKAQNAYNQQVKVVSNLETQYQTARAQLAGFQSAMDGVGEATQEATQQLNAQDVLAGAAGWDMIKTGVSGVTEALRESIQVGMEFDSAIADIAATMGTTVDDLGELRTFAQEMGSTTQFTASEAAQALNYMALAGYNAQTSMDMLPTVLDLAAAGGVELARASDMVTDAQSALGLSLEETSRLVDEMAKTSTKTNTSVAQLGEAILQVGGTAKFMSGGTAEINQVLGLLADNSIKGAEGGTKLRNIILSLSSPTEKAAKQLDSLGVSVFDAEGNMRAFSEIFPELQASLSRLTDQQQIEALGEIFNSRDIAAAQALLGTTIERWDELAVSIDGAAGAAEQMAKTRMDNLAGDITLLESAADGAKIALADSLTPALRDVTQAGTGILGFVGNVISDFPIAGQAAAGLAAAGVTLGAGMVASAAGIKSVSGAVGELTAALAGNPFGLLALGVGVGVTAFTALAAAANDAEQEVDSFWADMEASRAKYEESTAAIKAQSAEIDTMVSTLESLAAQENKTSAEKQTLVSLVEQLNEQVPDLNLSYDSLNDTLSLTAAQIREVALAQSAQEEQAATLERLKIAYVEQEKIAQRLKDAQEELNRATEAYNTIDTEGIIRTREEIIGAQRAYENATLAVEQLTEEYEVHSAEVEELESTYESLSAGVEENTGTIEKSTEASSEAAAAYKDLQMSAEDLEEATLYLSGAQDTLTSALKEQEQAGSLSLKTAQELIDSGYGAAIAIDEETGAVTLNKAAYMDLANAKINEQVANLEVQRGSLETAQKLLAEKLAAQDAANGYYDLSEAKTLAAYADDIQALDLQIAALNRAKSAMGSYSGAARTAAQSSSSASRKIKTQAEQDLETYKNLKAELDHQKNMDVVDEAKYYQQLEALRDQYLTDTANVSEYRKVTETIYKNEKEAAEKAAKAEKEASKAQLEAFKETKTELDHEHNMGLLNDEAYYRKLGEIRDQYLTDPGALDEYRKITETIYNAEQKSMEQASKAQLEAFKETKAELDHEHNMGLLNDEAYYRKLGEIRDQYLTDPGALDEYRKITETIYNAEQKSLEESGKLWQTASNNIIKLENDFQKALADRASAIANTYKLFDEVPKKQKASGAELMKNLENQVKSIETFYANMDALTDRDVYLAEGLADEIRSMGPAAAGQLEALLSLTDEKLQEYSDLYAEKQALANELAEGELLALRQQTNDAIVDQLADVAELYDTNAPELGLSFAKKLSAGMFEGMPVVESMAQTVANAAMSAFEQTYNRDVEAMMTASKSRVTTGDIGELLAGAVNGINAVGGATGSGTVRLQVNLNSRPIAEEIYPDMVIVAKESPQVKDDT